MADWLLLRLPHAAEQPATWLTADARGAPTGLAQSGPLSLAAPRAAGRRVCLLVPGAEVLLAEPELPVKAGVKLQQLVPYALEEHLAEDIDALHFAIGPRAAGSLRPPGGSPVTLPADALAEALEIAQSGAKESGAGGRGLILYTGASEWQQHFPP